MSGDGGLGGYHIGPVGDEVLGLARARQVEIESQRPTSDTGRRPSGALVLRTLGFVVLMLVLGGWLLTAINSTTP